ncbi:uncharacterized protein [Temnothorax nylanderi]
MPRSGAGADQPTYTPTWILYKDLRFLEDIIKPRKTSSNYKSKAPVNPSSQVPVFRTSSPSLSTSASGGEVTVLHTISPISSTSAVASPSPDMSSYSNDFFISLAGTDENSTDTSETLFSPPPITPFPTTSTPPPAITSGSGSNDTVAQVQRAMSNISNKRKAPPPDNFAFKKRQEADAVNKILIEQGKGLTNLAAKIGEAIMAPPPPPKSPSVVVSNTSPGTQPMLSAIGFALSTVPEHTQLKCLIGILQYINDFSNKSGQAQ